MQTAALALYAAEEPRTRADQIFNRFADFHRANPVIWQLFERFALDAAKRGRGTYGAGAIIERIRWHVDVETQGDVVKINNDYQTYYGRMFAVAHPDIDLFRTRRLKSASEPPFDVDLSVVPVAPDPGEFALTLKLLSLLGETL